MLDYIAHSFYFDGMTTDAAGNTPVAATDLKFVENTEAGKIHEVKVALAEGKTLYKDDAEVTEFPAIPNALLYKNGMTYYYTPVQHKAGFTVTDASKTGAEYGIVRNHFYNITVNSVTGLGTPVYNPDTEIPTEEVSVEAGYLAVKINVLSWRVVNQGVDL